MTVLVFGGRSPIALSSCLALSHLNDSVILATRFVDEEFQQLSKAYGVSGLLECNLQDSDEAVRLVDHFQEREGPISGIVFLHRYRGPSDDPIGRYVVEVLSPHRILEHLTATSKESMSAVIAVSPASRAVVMDQDFGYHASKAALQQLVRFGAVHWGAKGLRVNGISPGPFVFKERAREYYEGHPEVTDRVRRRVPLQRIAATDEVANAVAFLVSDHSSYVNGHILEVDGGVSCVDFGTFPEH